MVVLVVVLTVFGNVDSCIRCKRSIVKVVVVVVVVGVA